MLWALRSGGWLFEMPAGDGDSEDQLSEPLAQCDAFNISPYRMGFYNACLQSKYSTTTLTLQVN